VSSSSLPVATKVSGRSLLDARRVTTTKAVIPDIIAIAAMLKVCPVKICVFAAGTTDPEYSNKRAGVGAAVDFVVGFGEFVVVVCALPVLPPPHLQHISLALNLALS